MIQKKYNLLKLKMLDEDIMLCECNIYTNDMRNLFSKPFVKWNTYQNQ